MSTRKSRPDHAAQKGLSDEDRRKAYACDVTYATNNELGFDYLRDNMAGSLEECVQRGYDFFSAQFIDVDGNFHSYLKSDVKQLTRAEKSLMPNYSKTLSPAEIDDVVAFLYGLGR
jgi:hypothetical protein